MSRIGTFRDNSGWGWSLNSDEWVEQAIKDYAYPTCRNGLYAGPFDSETAAKKARKNLSARASHLKTMASRDQDPTPIEEFMKKHPK